MNNVFKYMVAASAALYLVGCASVHRAEKVVVPTPSPYVLIPDAENRVQVDMHFLIPEHYFSKRSRLFITPQFISADTVAQEYFPLVVDAPIYRKKMHRKEVLEGYIDPYSGQTILHDRLSRAFSVPYQDTLLLPKHTENGRMRAVVSTDGCGQCTGLDSLYIAAVSNPVSLMEQNWKPAWMDDEFTIRPKVMKGKGVARLQFIINRHDINLDLGNNRQELDSMRLKLEPILKDSLAIIEYLNIYGMASADGSLPFNTVLSRNRANSALRWLIDELNIPMALRQKMKVGSRPEGWMPVFQAMVADGNPDSVAVKRILMLYASDNDDVQERHIRRLPCWNTIKERYLQKDRKVEYEYAYRLKSFTTDSELLSMYETRPDVFNLDELLRVATLFTDVDRKREVYQRTLRRYPSSAVAATNLSALYLNEGNADSALQVLQGMQADSVELKVNRAVALAASGNTQAALDSLEGIRVPEALYNKGMLLACDCRFAEAYECLKNHTDVNTAIVALAINRNEEAAIIMSKLEDTRPLAEYVRALVAARLGDARSCRMHLRKAFEDPSLARRAIDEPDFLRFRGEQSISEWLWQEGGQS